VRARGGVVEKYIARKESNDEYRFLRRFTSVKFRFVHSTRQSCSA
jgi:hypothetical protein